MGLKTGLNRAEQHKLLEMVEKGYPIENIARQLKVKLEVAQRFVPKPKKKAKAKKIAADKKPDNPNVDVTSGDA